MKCKAKLVNPFKKVGALEQKDEKHWQETNRGKKLKLNSLFSFQYSTDSDNEIVHDSDTDENTIVEASASLSSTFT